MQMVRSEGYMQFSEIKMKAMKNEADVKENVKRIFRAFAPDVWWFMPVASGYGVQGVPDFIACVHGWFFGIETKFGDNKPSVHQRIQADNIDRAHGYIMYCYETDLEKVFNSVQEAVAVGRAMIALEQ